MSKTTKIIIIVVVAVILASVAYWYFAIHKKKPTTPLVKVADTPKMVEAANNEVLSKAVADTTKK